MNKNFREILESDDRYKAYMSLVDLYMKDTPELRAYVNRQWDFGVKWVYPNQKRLACAKGEIFSREERLRASLAYDAISAKYESDIRENLIAYAVIYNSCLYASIKPNVIFTQVINVAPKEVADSLRRFLARPSQGKDMAAFMLKAVKNADDETEIQLNI
ncbi:MAG: hypothetical protein LBL13_06215 [Bacteroidales bacterium]|jgi:hypothetical protein|nr:hypothetical protein [Bacteroidales bacterium]